MSDTVSVPYAFSGPLWPLVLWYHLTCDEVTNSNRMRGAARRGLILKPQGDRGPRCGHPVIWSCCTGGGGRAALGGPARAYRRPRACSRRGERPHLLIPRLARLGCRLCFGVEGPHGMVGDLPCGPIGLDLPLLARLVDRALRALARSSGSAWRDGTDGAPFPFSLSLSLSLSLSSLPLLPMDGGWRWGEEPSWCPSQVIFRRELSSSESWSCETKAGVAMVYGQ